MRYPSGHSSARGILVLEALIAFALFLLASIALFGMMAQTRRAESKARQSLVANAYARQLMEAARLKGYSGLQIGTSKAKKSFATYHIESGRKNKPQQDGSTEMTSTVTVYDGPGAGVRSILVKVTWYQGFVELESYVTQ